MSQTNTIPSPASADSGARRFTAPGRVNLIGEHTDYTGGLVMPLAIPFFTEATVAAAEDSNAAGYTFRSEQFETARAMSKDDRSERTGEWTDYPVGVLRELQGLGIEPPPFTLHLKGNVPLGAGLSSSASVEVATAVALLAHSGASLSTAEIATLCRRAENVYVGSPCGIMDQFVSTAARAGHALLLNTRDLSFDLLPLNRGELAGCRIVVANSMVKHSIAGGDYGVRRRELEAGQAVLLARFPEARDLGDLLIDQVLACEAEMSPESFRRCRHIVSENARVREAGEAMLAGDPRRLGKVMTRAHASERDDFECSVEEVDFLVDTAVALEGCYGARLTGGGFGGCTVNLVATTHAETFKEQLTKIYRERFGIEIEVYLCEAVDGAVARNAASTEKPAEKTQA